MNATFDPPVRTIAALLHRLGDIPPDRVRFDPVPGTATRADLLKPGNHRCELVDGTLVEKAMSEESSFLGMSLVTFLNQLVMAHNLGYVTGEQGFYDLPDGPVRGPDIAFTAWHRLPTGRRGTAAFPSHAPDLAVEVLSPGNTRAEMDRKRGEYFRAGVRLVWEIDPRARTVRVYVSADGFRELTTADTLTGDPVLPGFVLPLAQLFAELDRHG